VKVRISYQATAPTKEDNGVTEAVITCGYYDEGEEAARFYHRYEDERPFRVIKTWYEIEVLEF